MINLDGQQVSGEATCSCDLVGFTRLLEVTLPQRAAVMFTCQETRALNP